MRQIKISQRITSRESRAVETYLHEISRSQVLTPEQEIELAKRIKQGDSQALDLLVKSNLRFVVSVVKQYQNYGLSFGDLINEGNIGLIKAAVRYDETRGFKFISYAVWWIRQAVMGAIVEYGRMVRIPSNQVNIFNKVYQAYLEELHQAEYEPDMHAVADRVGLTIEKVEEIMGYNHPQYVSLSTPSVPDDEESASMAESLPDNDCYSAPDDAVMRESEAIEVLSDVKDVIRGQRERKIFVSLLGLNGEDRRSVEDVSKEYKLSVERVRQLRNNGIQRLQRLYQARGISA